MGSVVDRICLEVQERAERSFFKMRLMTSRKSSGGSCWIFAMFRNSVAGPCRPTGILTSREVFLCFGVVSTWEYNLAQINDIPRDIYHVTDIHHLP